MQQDYQFRNDYQTQTDCILCAAGGAKRMGDWKPLLPWGESTLVDVAVDAALEAGCRVILVTGNRGEELEERFRNRNGVVTVRNDEWKSGMVSSIKKGALLVESRRFFVSHADMPFVDAHVYRSLLERAEELSSTEEQSPLRKRPRVWRPRFHDLPGHPVLFDATALPLLSTLADGETLKFFLPECDLFFLESADPGATIDMDDPSSYLAELAKSVKSKKLFSLKDKVPLAITGERSCGKTTHVRNLFYQAVAAGLSSCAITQVQTGRFEDGRGTGFDMEMMASFGDGRTVFVHKALARTNSDGEDATNFPSDASLIVLGPYRFNVSVFAEALSFVRDFISQTENQNRFFAIDEIGKLELLRAEGLLPVLETVVAAITLPRSPSLPQYLSCAARFDTLNLFESYLNKKGLQMEKKMICRDSIIKR